MAKKKKDEDEYYKDKTFVKGAKKIQTKTKAGSILTEGTIQEDIPSPLDQGGKPIYSSSTRQKKFKGVIDPATARLQQLSGGEGFLKEGTPEQLQFQKEFPNLGRGIFDPEAAAFRSPSSSPAEIERDRIMMEQQRKKLEEGQTQLEAQGAFEQVTPTRPDLTPSERPLAGIPVLGPAIAALSSAIEDRFKNKTVTGETEFLQTEESIREAALRQIKQKSYDKGVSFSEGFGSLIESIPVVGALASKYARGLIETPSSNAANVIAEIDKVKEAASTGQEKVRNGLEDPDYGLDRARKMEEQLSELQGRLKLLINTSPILRANADEISKIEEGILEAQEKVARYRTAASYGLTAQLTGTGRTIPTDEQMYYELAQR